MVWHMDAFGTSLFQCCRISYLEIFNEVMYDLLSTLPGSSPSGSLYIVEDAGGGVSVKGLQSHLAPTEEEALNLLFVVG